MENEKIPEGENIYSVVNAKVASVKPEECDVYFLPFLYGSNAHPLGKGAFIGLTAGVYKDYEDAAKHMVHVSGRVEPNPQMHEIYQKKYEKYHAVSKALDTVWGQFEV